MGGRTQAALGNSPCPAALGGKPVRRLDWQGYELGDSWLRWAGPRRKEEGCLEKLWEPAVPGVSLWGLAG